MTTTKAQVRAPFSMGGVPRTASARFRAPTHVRNVIERRRVLDGLRGSAGRQLTVIHAPAGYGKTTLAVQWLEVLQNAGASVAWLGLHRDDNAPHWFLTHLLEAVQRVLKGAAEAIDDLVELIEQGSEDMQGYTLSVLLELIGEHQGGFVLAFDDWHVVEDAAVRRALVHLLDFAPPNLSIVLTSRCRPQLPLSRLRVRNQLVEIDADVLRFDLDEAREFLVELNGLRLDGADVARLSEGTDGWVAALQLVSLSLRDSDDPNALISGFSGRHHSVGEYLAENVLDALAPDVLDFLLATSVCDRLCGDLAGVLAEGGDGQAMLEELESRDLFLRPLDGEREWFRYHHLFADYLRRRLERDHPGRAAGLHARASVWFAEHDLVSEAVDHALAGGDVERATDLVEQHAMPLVEHSRMVSLLGLLGRLPATAADDRPALLMAVSWANCLLQRSEAAQSSLDVLRSVLPGGDGHRDDEDCHDEHGEMRSEADVVQACIDIYGDRTDRAEGLVRMSLDRSQSYRPWVVAVAANIQSFCDIHAMRFAAARERQQWARRFHDRTTGPFAGVYGRCFAGMAALSQLDTTGAEAHLQGAVVLARESAGRRSHAAQLAGALLGELHYVRGQLDEAERLLAESGELGAESGVVDFMIASFALLARIKAGRGAADEAAELLLEGAQVADRLGLTRLRTAVGAERISQLLARGRIREARRVARDLPEGSGRHGGIGTQIDQLRTSSLAAVHSAEGDHERAIALVQDLIVEARRWGQLRTAVELSVRLAGIQERASRFMAAERTLAGVLDRVVARGTPQLVREGGPEVRAVLERVTARAREAASTDTLPAVEQLEAVLAVADRDDAPSPTDLTGREREILQMLDLGRGNQQIASAIGVTVNTVKWYLKNIYSKLGAGNRTEAVSVARRQGLLG
jgi:LuxR family maltose regulon positive regulatory protein/serine/threonine-protein kinase PknK